jgi:serine protease Do
MRSLTLSIPLVASLLLTGCQAVQEASADAPHAASPPASFDPRDSLAPLVEAVQPAVVNVYTSARRAIPREYQYFFGMPSERTVEGQGSGFVISADGYILTNRHVVDEFSDFRVKFPTGEEYTARKIGVDSGSDVALLKIEPKGALRYLRLADSDKVRVGDWVVAVGNPLGLGHTVTAGIVSGKGRSIPNAPFDEFLQTDASINPGNSGGPLVGLDGTVVGMNTAIIQGANTVGFAITANQIAEVVPQLREGGKVARGYLGVQMAELPEAARKAIGQGVLLAEVEPGGPAEKAGLRGGDLVTKVGDREVLETRDLLRAVSGKTPGATVDVTYVREGKSRTARVTLGERPGGAE